MKDFTVSLCSCYSFMDLTKVFYLPTASKLK